MAAVAGARTVAGDEQAMTGPLIMLKPGVDFALPAGCAVGQSGSWNINCTMTVQNQSAIDMRVNLPVITLTAVLDGFATTNEESGETSLAQVGLSEMAVLEAQRRSDDVVSTASQRATHATQVVGGNFIAPFLPALYSVAKAVGKAALPHVAKLASDAFVKTGVERGVHALADKLQGKGLSGGARTGGRLSLAERLAM